MNKALLSDAEFEALVAAEEISDAEIAAMVAEAEAAIAASYAEQGWPLP